MLAYSNRVHTHLDWYDTERWLDAHDMPICLAWQGDKLVGLLAASLPLNRTCWIRLAAVRNRLDAPTILRQLWDSLMPEMRSLGIRQAYILVLKDWLNHHIPALGFEQTEQVISLRRNGVMLPETPPLASDVYLRPAEFGDMDAIRRVDHAAFEPPWQFAPDELRQAYRIADSCTIAVRGDTIVGYQISTNYHDSGHLARLAVTPSEQGTGIGAALVDHVIHRFWRHGITVVTVNTQESNVRSQHLYQRYDFRRTGYDLPVWSRNIG